MIFVVFKHLPAEDDDDDEVYYDIGLETWITEINDDMTGKIIWPPDKIDAGPFVRRQKPHDTTWQAQPVIFKKFYPTYLEARAGCNNRIEDTNYDTDNVPTKRIRRVPRKLQDSSSSDDKKPDRPLKIKRSGLVAVGYRVGSRSGPL
ncbi:Quinolinate synthase A [Frankliniella fusca]|uniref:Quinolinate synthase A n=1 Tax=Frankliniella fusca TaxID=407009 RepID=A0AAE1GUW4_9NEOP|nr:Quinolinate synthase A [Frankliniella fusca]